MAGASVTIRDPYSLFNNIGCLAKVMQHSVFGGYQSRYGIREFQVVGAGVVYHSEIGNAGVGFYKFGDDLYSQQKVHLAISNQFQMVSLGVGVDLVQYTISTIGTKQALAIQFGGVAEISSQFSFGAHIYNLNQAKLVKETGESIPTLMKAGISWQPGSELMINIEVEKDLDFDEVLKVGLEYQIIENVYLRTGIRTRPFVSSFGVGFSPKKFLFDYSYTGDSALGAIHELSLAYAISQ